MPQWVKKIIKNLQKFLVYLIEDVRIVHYVLLFIFLVLFTSLSYYILTPFSHGIGRDGLPLNNLTFRNSLYFSLVTVSSLGYGDMHPMGFSKLIACAEVLIGLIFMGIMLARMTSMRLSYHVRRLFASETQKRLNEFADGFESLHNRLTQTTKMLGQTFQDTPTLPSPQDKSSIAGKFAKVIDLFYIRSTEMAEYLSYEVEHGSFFTMAPIDAMKRSAEAIEQAVFLLGQMILSMTTEARGLLLNPANRKRILSALEEQKKACRIVNESCKIDGVKQKFAQILQTCHSLPESFFATPITMAKAEQPDQKLESTDQPLPES